MSMTLWASIFLAGHVGMAIRSNEDTASMLGSVVEQDTTSPVSCQQMKDMMVSNISRADQILGLACAGGATCFSNGANVSQDLSSVVSTLGAIATVADEHLCLGQIMSDASVISSLQELREKYWESIANTSRWVRVAMEELDEVEDRLVEMFPMGTLDRRSSRPYGKDNCPDPCKRCVDGRKVGRFVCVLPWSARGETPSSDDIICEKPSWKVRKFRHQVQCRSPTVIVNYFQQSKLNAFLTCVSESLAMRLKSSANMEWAEEEYAWFDICMLQEQGLALTPVQKDLKDRWDEWYGWVDDEPAHVDVVAADARSAFMIFQVTEFAAGLGGVRLRSTGNTLAPHQTVAQAWRSFNHSTILASFVPSIDCERAVWTKNIFASILRPVLAVTLGLTAAVLSGPFLGPYATILWAQVLLNYPLKLTALGYALGAMVSPLAYVYGTLKGAMDVFTTTYAYFTRHGYVCNPVVALGSGDEPPVCIAGFRDDRPIDYSSGVKPIDSPFWSREEQWQPNSTREITCPNGLRGEAHCGRGGVTTVRCP